jgi:hypothetical protein
VRQHPNRFESPWSPTAVTSSAVENVNIAFCRASRAAAITCLLLVAGAATACDPCSGVARCANGAYLAVDGQIVDPITGAGIDGARISVIRVGGVTLDVDSLETTTADGGHWRLELAPQSVGRAIVDVVVAAPGAAGYRARGISLETRKHGGDANVLPPWVPVPYFSYAGEFYRYGTTAEPVIGALVEFRRTGGVQLIGPGVASGGYHTTTDAGGRFLLFPTRTTNSVFPTALEEVVGDFIVDLGPALGTTIIRGVTLQPTPLYRLQNVVIRYAVGPGTP